MSGGVPCSAAGTLVEKSSFWTGTSRIVTPGWVASNDLMAPCQTPRSGWLVALFHHVSVTLAEEPAEAGVPVHDADVAVHQLYTGEAVSAIEAAFPGTTSAQGVDRNRLASRVVGNVPALRQLEAIVHPLVRREEEKFLEAAEQQSDHGRASSSQLLGDVGHGEPL